MFHYTYQITVSSPTDARKFYIGARTSTVKPEQDAYFGSCKPFKRWQKEHGTDCLVKQVLAVWPTREDALSHEILLHDIFDVARNPEFWNQAKQTAPLFDTTGTKQSDELRLQKSLKTKGRPKSEEHKAKIGAALKGKPKSEQHRLKISTTRTGMPSPMKGKSMGKGRPKSAEHKAKIGAANLGKKRTPEQKALLSALRKAEAKTKKKSLTAYEKIKCPHCGKIGMKANMKRYHFDNCKKVA
jgi:hypothetical protein